ncbi:uncharacterized protein PODANS_6_7480 [Podospora anserina S mat+]|uniref:Podospora anserina S mat+ genomic DNA chromosome 6, supercontig 2 n=1 Tax=Podospora anserina (strain S / ATCC MYA-4624 / DSM 980 / FGSC 10383) TaxID=515849 RepID=B2B3W5_PODAN|nr:uncharacterized protein PODANS_6_7480 [Podospora anserina S mat+]CAP71801.1 unnamed protein product [Podospora anserina S mat+]CDP31192.1 Putative protein of unknown function [Podospora anserina S mat+]
MRITSFRTRRWLLLSDLHFKHQDLDRVRQMGRWIVAEAERNHVSRVVICGDLLISRTMQPTHVFSACYRFISHLSDVAEFESLALRRTVTLKEIINGPRDRFEEMCRFYEKHHIRPVVDRSFGFEEAVEAMKYLASGSHFGKVVVKVE